MLGCPFDLSVSMLRKATAS